MQTSTPQDGRRGRLPRPPERSPREIWAFGAGLAAGVLAAAIGAELWPRSATPDLELYREVRDAVSESFVRDVDPDLLVDRALHAMAEGLDEYSRYYSAGEVAVVERETQGRYRGIGVVFKEPIEEGRILFAMPESPAQRAGLDVGDRILSIDGTPLTQMSSEQLRAVIGDSSSSDTLRLLVRSLDGEERERAVARDVLLDPSVRHARMLDPERGIGYLALRSFSDATPDEFDAAMAALAEEDLRGLVVDVRGNYGGLLHAAIELANRFLAEGVIVSTRGRGENVPYEAVAAKARWSGLPLAVLVDGESASASEIFAAALQDHRAAALVGSPTYGKGTVQRVKAVDEGRALLKVTTSYYFTPAGRNLERTVDKAWEFGILPDVWVPLEADQVAALHARLERYSAPEEAQAKLRAWEQLDQIVLLPPWPEDAQLEAALALLRGEAPRRSALAAHGER